MESMHAQQQNQTSMRLQIPDLKGKEDLFRFLDAAITTPGPEMASAAGYLNILVGEFAGKSAFYSIAAFEPIGGVAAENGDDGAQSLCAGTGVDAVQHPEQRQLAPGVDTAKLF